MTKSVEARADEIAARLKSRTRPCVVARHPEAALIDALIVRDLSSLAIQTEIPNGPSDSSIRAHRKGVCSCPKK